MALHRVYKSEQYEAKSVRKLLGDAIFSGEVEHFLKYVLTIHNAYIEGVGLTEIHLDYILKMKCRSSNRVYKYLLYNLLLPYTKYTYRLWSSEQIGASLFGQEQKLDDLGMLVGYKTISYAISIVNTISRMGEAIKYICPVVAEIEKSLSDDIYRAYYTLIDSLEHSTAEYIRELVVDLQNMIFAVTLESNLLQPCLETTLTRSAKYLEYTKLEYDG